MLYIATMTDEERQRLIERIAEAILDEMDLMDGLDAVSARRYAERAIEVIEEMKTP
jgi:hypothetical protein